MATSLERRMEALEAGAVRSWRWVWQYRDETVEAAKQRAGLQPGERVVVFSWLDAEL